MEERNRVVETHYKENFSTLSKLISGRVGGVYNAEDVVQEAFYRSIKFYPSYTPDKEFEGWFMGILSNCVKDFQREEQLGGMSTSGEDSTEELVDIKHLDLPHQEVLDEIYKKKDHTKEILKLYFIKGYTPKDISQQLGVNNKTIRMCVYRFRKDMEEKFGPGGF